MLRGNHRNTVQQSCTQTLFTFHTMDVNSAVVIATCGVIVAKLVTRKINRRKRRTVWVREWVKNRETYGVYQHLLQELRLGDAATYRNFMRMDCTTFQFLLNLVGPKITFRDTHQKRVIPAGERLALTLRFLATGNYNQ